MRKNSWPYTLSSPLSALDCYFYKAMAWQSEDSGERREWRSAGEEVLYAPCLVEDDTGRMLVDPSGAEIDVPKDFDQDGSLDAMPENVPRFAARRGISAWAAAKFEEYCIKPGDTLYVLGTLGENSGAPGISHASSGQNRFAAVQKSPKNLYQVR